MPYELSGAALKALRIIHNWDGDLSPDFEDDIGCHGAAMEAVMGTLLMRGYITIGAWGTYPLTDKGRATINA